MGKSPYIAFNLDPGTDGGSRANAITATGDYQAGVVFTGAPGVPGVPGKAAVWNGSPLTFVDLHSVLPASYFLSEATSIFESGGSLYVGGYARVEDTGGPRDHAILWVGPSFFARDSGRVVFQPSAPAPVRLGNPSPNPAAPHTTIPFTLAAAGKVRLSVFSIAGREVRRLVEQVMPAGAHAAFWDGRNTRGEFVARGVYWVRLEPSLSGDAGPHVVAAHKIVIQ